MKRTEIYHSVGRGETLKSKLGFLVRNSPLQDDDEFRFNDASTNEGHLRQNGEHGFVVKRL